MKKQKLYLACMVLIMCPNLFIQAQDHYPYRTVGEYYLNLNSNLEYQWIRNVPQGSVDQMAFYGAPYVLYGVELGRTFSDYDLAITFMHGDNIEGSGNFTSASFNGALYMDTMWELGLQYRKYSGLLRFPTNSQIAYGWTARTSYLRLMGDEYVYDAGFNGQVQDRDLHLVSLDSGFFFELSEPVRWRKYDGVFTLNLQPIFVRATNKGFGLGFVKLGTVIRF